MAEQGETSGVRVATPSKGEDAAGEASGKDLPENLSKVEMKTEGCTEVQNGESKYHCQHSCCSCVFNYLHCNMRT